MKEDLIKLPDFKAVEEMIGLAKADIEEEVKKDPELLPLSLLVSQVINVIEEKLAKKKDFDKLNSKEKIDVAAHLNFLHCLLEDFFCEEEFEDDYDDEESDELDDEESLTER